MSERADIAAADVALLVRLAAAAVRGEISPARHDALAAAAEVRLEFFSERPAAKYWRLVDAGALRARADAIDPPAKTVRLSEEGDRLREGAARARRDGKRLGNVEKGAKGDDFDDDERRQNRHILDGRTAAEAEVYAREAKSGTASMNRRLLRRADEADQSDPPAQYAEGDGHDSPKARKAKRALDEALDAPPPDDDDDSPGAAEAVRRHYRAAEARDQLERDIGRGMGNKEHPALRGFKGFTEGDAPEPSPGYRRARARMLREMARRNDERANEAAADEVPPVGSRRAENPLHRRDATGKTAAQRDGMTDAMVAQRQRRAADELDPRPKKHSEHDRDPRDNPKHRKAQRDHGRVMDEHPEGSDEFLLAQYWAQREDHEHDLEARRGRQDHAEPAEEGGRSHGVRTDEDEARVRRQPSSSFRGAFAGTQEGKRVNDRINDSHGRAKREGRPLPPMSLDEKEGFAEEPGDEINRRKEDAAELRRARRLRDDADEDDLAVAAHDPKSAMRGQRTLPGTQAPSAAQTEYAATRKRWAAEARRRADELDPPPADDEFGAEEDYQTLKDHAGDEPEYVSRLDGARALAHGSNRGRSKEDVDGENYDIDLEDGAEVADAVRTGRPVAGTSAAYVARRMERWGHGQPGEHDDHAEESAQDEFHRVLRANHDRILRMFGLADDFDEQPEDTRPETDRDIRARGGRNAGWSIANRNANAGDADYLRELEKGARVDYSRAGPDDEFAEEDDALRREVEASNRRSRELGGPPERGEPSPPGEFDADSVAETQEEIGDRNGMHDGGSHPDWTNYYVNNGGDGGELARHANALSRAYYPDDDEDFAEDGEGDDDIPFDADSVAETVDDLEARHGHGTPAYWDAVLNMVANEGEADALEDMEREAGQEFGPDDEDDFAEDAPVDVFTARRRGR